VVYLPLWKIWVKWEYYSQYMESHKIHVPNHQPVIFHPFFWEISRPLASKPSRFRSIAALGESINSSSDRVVRCGRMCMRGFFPSVSPCIVFGLLRIAGWADLNMFTPPTKKLYEIMVVLYICAYTITIAWSLLSIVPWNWGCPVFRQSRWFCHHNVKPCRGVCVW